jgi:hypothetical protein
MALGVALFGRKINNAEHQLAFIEMLRFITEGRISPEEAVRAYHAILEARKIQPKLPLEKDLELTDQSMSYDGSAVQKARVTIRDNPLARSTSTPARTNPAQNCSNGTWPKLPDGSPDFARMTSQERRAFDTFRLTRKFG